MWGRVIKAGSGVSAIVLVDALDLLDLGSRWLASGGRNVMVSTRALLVRFFASCVLYPFIFFVNSRTSTDRYSRESRSHRSQSVSGSLPVLTKRASRICSTIVKITESEATPNFSHILRATGLAVSSPADTGRSTASLICFIVFGGIWCQLGYFYLLFLFYFPPRRFDFAPVLFRWVRFLVLGRERDLARDLDRVLDRVLDLGLRPRAAVFRLNVDLGCFLLRRDRRPPRFSGSSSTTDISSKFVPLFSSVAGPEVYDDSGKRS